MGRALPAAAQGDVYVRFLDPKPSYYPTADARLALVDCDECKLKFELGGRGLTDVSVDDGTANALLTFDRERGRQTLVETVHMLQPGLKLVRVHVVDRSGQRHTFAIRLARLPAPGAPPVIALVAPPEPGDHAFARGIVLGDASGRLFIDQDRVGNRTYLDGAIVAGSRLHEFASCIELHPGRNKLWFGLQSSQFPESAVYAEICNGDCREPVVKPAKKSQTAPRAEAR